MSWQGNCVGFSPHSLASSFSCPIIHLPHHSLASSFTCPIILLPHHSLASSFTCQSRQNSRLACSAPCRTCFYRPGRVWRPVPRLAHCVLPHLQASLYEASLALPRFPQCSIFTQQTSETRAITVRSDSILRVSFSDEWKRAEWAGRRPSALTAGHGIDRDGSEVSRHSMNEGDRHDDGECDRQRTGSGERP